MTAGLVGSSGFAAIPTTAIDLPLVQRLRRSPRFRVRVRVPKQIDVTIAASPGGGAGEKGQLVALEEQQVALTCGPMSRNNWTLNTGAMTAALIIAASAVTYMDPSLRDAGWGLLIVGGAAGLSGALGTRLLVLVMAGLQRKFGS